MSHSLTIDGQVIDLEGLYREPSDKCGEYWGLAKGWQPGPHSCVWTISIDQPINDGWDSYPAGDYVMEFEIDVLPPPSAAPAPTPAASAAEHFEKGFEYFKQGKWDEAIAEFQEAIRLAPDFGAAYEGLGYSYFRKGEYEQAIQALERYLQLEPGASDRVDVETDINRMRCCRQPPEPGKGQIWFENHTGDIVHVDISPYYFEIPPKQGDVAGCLCPQLDPGHYSFVGKTGTHEARFEVDIVAGRTLHHPIFYPGY
jgi:tetratricopeptide (TPR) repeat protein